ncbi:MAG: hypothetical protein EON57_12015 [Alphaproteobacteria bacterium]|nr:MAG: hypothetical protein EON57_12015 [Alphaproteobacteria bacterium]
MKPLEALAWTNRFAALGHEFFIGRAARQNNFTEIERLLKVPSRSFDESAAPGDAALPPDWAQSLEASCPS